MEGVQRAGQLQRVLLGLPQQALAFKVEAQDCARKVVNDLSRACWAAPRTREPLRAAALQRLAQRGVQRPLFGRGGEGGGDS